MGPFFRSYREAMIDTVHDNSDRPTSLEVQATREVLGLTMEGLAQALHVNARTVRSWEQGRRPVPVRVGDELAALVTATDQAVAALHEVAQAGQDVPGWRDEDDFADVARRLHITIPEGAGARWWRHAARRAVNGTPARIVPTTPPLNGNAA